MFSHSIRPDLKESRGFILPYKEYLELDENIFQGKGLSKIQALDEIKLSLDKFDSSGKIFDELSYGCDFISNHSMLLILEAARRSLEAVIRHGLAGSIEDGNVNSGGLMPVLSISRNKSLPSLHSLQHLKRWE